MPVLTGIDILGIQSYVFASNRLRDVLAASYMAERVTSAQQLARWGRNVEHVLLAAGGNAIVEFDTLTDAQQWTARYTRWVQDTAPGLETAIVHREYQNGHLAWALKALAVDLARTKVQRCPSAPQLGLSVTASCAITGVPATEIDQEGTLVSPRVQRLRGQLDAARERWVKYLPPAVMHAPSWMAEFPLELDLMGRTAGETSLIGIVHVDGNGVGEAIKEWLQNCIDEELGDDKVRAQYHEWSEDLNTLGETVLRTVVARVADCIVEEIDGGHKKSDRHCVLRGTPHDLGFRLHDWRNDTLRRTEKQTVFLPVRPLVLGGDDLTFVCDGRIALDLAVAALQEFEAGSIRHLGEDGVSRTITACAGVALVRAHAPFYRSYELAEDLCQTAKRARRAANTKTNAETGSWLDWHVGTVRPGESVEEVRERQYQAGTRTLTMRPYPLAQVQESKRTWQWLDENLLGPAPGGGSDDATFRAAGPNAWSGSRGRVKLLGSLVASGGAEIKRQIDAWTALGSQVQLPGGLDTSGYVDSATPLRDAIELLDLHIRLEPDRGMAGGATATAASATASREEGAS